MVSRNLEQQDNFYECRVTRSMLEQNSVFDIHMKDPVM